MLSFTSGSSLGASSTRFFFNTWSSLLLATPPLRLLMSPRAVRTVLRPCRPLASSVEEEEGLTTPGAVEVEVLVFLV
jgi:hypothetical protein